MSVVLPLPGGIALAVSRRRWPWAVLLLGTAVLVARSARGGRRIAAGAVPLARS